MAEVGADIPLSPGQASGEDDDLTWSVDIAPTPGASGQAGSLMTVTVTVAARDGRPLVTLKSLRLGGA